MIQHQFLKGCIFIMKNNFILIILLFQLFLFTSCREMNSYIEVEEIKRPLLIFPSVNSLFLLDTISDNKIKFILERSAVLNNEIYGFTILGYELQISKDLNFSQRIFSRIVEFNFQNHQDTTYISSKIFGKSEGYFWRARIIPESVRKKLYIDNS
jgi:hypothetical protein